MKILIINDYSYNVGGAEKVIFDNVELLKKAGHEVVFLGKDKKPLIPLFSGWFSFVYFIKTLTLIHNFKPHIVHVHNCIRNISPSPILAAKMKRVPVIMTVHDYNIVCPKVWMIDQYNKPCRFGLSKNCFFDDCHNPKMGIIWYPYHWVRIVKLIFQRYLISVCVDCFLYPSFDLKKWIEKTFRNAKSIYIPNFVSENNTGSERKKIGKFFMYVGRLSKDKGVEVLIKAVDLLVYSYKINIRLNIIGDGKERKMLEKLVQTLRLETYITFKGKFSKAKLRKYYLDSLAVIIPSVCMDNSPLVAYEAMSYSVPIIASNIGGIPDLVEHNKNGFLFEMGNSADLARYMEKIYKNTELNLTFGKMGFQKAKTKLNKNLFYKKTIKIYQGIIKP